jgi:divalent metal cation (Fe/Co/Zn/Cd) transporter
MKIAGLLLMLAGWGIALSAVSLLHALPAQTAFCLAGIAIEIAGFVLVARVHLPQRRVKHDA